MKTKNLIKLMTLALIIFCWGCGGSNDPEPTPQPVNPDPVIPTPQPEPEEKDPTGLFDYSKAGDHPRLFIRKNEFLALRAKVDASPWLKTMHDLIIKKCDDTYMKAATLEYKLDVSGKRLLTVSRDALARICFLSYAYCMTDDDKYLIKAQDNIDAVCAFFDWHPSHYLDVAEMALGVAIGYDWLYNRLPQKTKDAVVKAMTKYAFDTYQDAKYNKQFIDHKNNWNQVCNGGLVAAAIALYETNKARAKDIIETAVKSNVIPLEAYAPDGNYPEGYGYWNYGTSYQVVLMSALQKAFGSDNGLSKYSGLQGTGEYILFMTGSSNKAFNYADNGSGMSHQLPLWWFAADQKQPALLYHEIEMLKKNNTGSFSGDRLLPLTLVYATDIDVSTINPPTKKLWHGEGYTPVVLIRTGWKGGDVDHYVGIKGGKAAENHGHMDVGSFVYDALGVRWAMDFGNESYAPIEAAGVNLWGMGQNSTRWNIFRYNNKAHNTITINDQLHKVDGFASFTEIIETDKELGAVLDMSKVFLSGVQKATRKIVLKEEKDLEITDEIDTSEKDVIRWSMVTPANVKQKNDTCFELSQDDKTMYLTVKSNTPFKLKTWSTVGEHDYDSKNPDTIIIGFESTVEANKTVKYTVTISEKE